MSFKFGDMVRNDWAGEVNPYKVGMFIYYTTRKSGPFSKTRFAVFAKDGERWEHDSNDEKLVVTGNIFDEIADLKTELREAGEIISSCIRESGQAEERGAGRLIAAIHSSGRCNLTENELMQLWREGRK